MPCLFWDWTVGGFVKLGTRFEVLDITLPEVVTINVLPNWESQERPVPFRLLDSALKGTVIFRFNPSKSKLALDNMTSLCYAPSNTTVSFYCKNEAEPNFVALTRNSLEQRLIDPVILIKVDMERATYSDGLPTFSYMRVQWLVNQQMEYRADIPRIPESSALEDLGIYDMITNQSFFFDADLKQIERKDVVRVMGGRRYLKNGTTWSVTEINNNPPLDELTSWDIQLRFLHDYEIERELP